jgi:CRP/FNR family cyclic AMP-dependent transcriptional regulator
VAERQPSVGVRLLQMLAQRLRRAESTLADVAFADVYGRQAKQLLDFGGRFGTTVGRADLGPTDLSEDQLAQLVGSSRETVISGLGDFANRGWIRVESGSVAILPPDRLTRRARYSR